jgi:hypothetical protein
VNFLHLMHPKLTYQLGLSNRVQLIEALKEVQVQEENITFLAADYKDILDQAKKVRHPPGCGCCHQPAAWRTTMRHLMSQLWHRAWTDATSCQSKGFMW